MLTVGYTLLAGLLGVVLTDFLHFGLAFAGSIWLAVAAVADTGGLSALLDALRGDPARLAIVRPRRTARPSGPSSPTSA